MADSVKRASSVVEIGAVPFWLWMVDIEAMTKARLLRHHIQIARELHGEIELHVVRHLGELEEINIGLVLEIRKRVATEIEGLDRNCDISGAAKSQ